MPKATLDAIDGKILQYLVRNARMPFLEIARECGISGAAIHQRIRKLHDSGVILGSRLIVEALERLEAGSLVAQKQNEADSCYAKMLTKEMGKIDWSQPSIRLERQVRGLYSWPGAYTGYRGKLLKIRAAKADPEAPDGAPGTVSRTTKDAIWVNTGEGKLMLKEVQLEGKKRMAAKDFLLGYKIGKGEEFQCL